MKKVLFTLIFLCYAPYVMGTMNIVYFNNFPSFSWISNGKMQGILIDVLNESLQVRMKIPVTHSGYPWARAQRMVQVGEADAFVTVPTPERKTYTNVSTEPVVIATFTIFVKKGYPKAEALKKIKTPSELKGYRIGHYLGSGWAEKNLAGMKPDLTSSLDLTLKKLAAGRFDVFTDVSQVVRYRIKELGFENQIIELPNIIDSSTFNLCIRKNSQYADIIPRFDETIRKMREEGKLQEIYDKY